MTSPTIQLNASVLSRLVEVSRVLNSTTNLGQLLDYIITEAAKLTNAEAASILLFNQRTRQLYFVAASNEVAPGMAETPVPIEGSIAGAVLTANQPLYIPDVSKDPRWNQNVDEAIDFKTDAILGVPMRNVEGQPVGVLEAINKLEGTFTKQDVDTLSTLADLAGVAVEKARLIEELRRANAELNELDHLKTDFIAVASHELRTPLAIILGYVSFLREEASPDMAKHLDSVLTAANRLRRLIQEMLNFQYTASGEESLKRQQTDLVAFVREVMETQADDALAKEQTMTAHLPAKPVYVAIDHETMRVALGNLINNAIKFTPKEGCVDLYVEQRGPEAWLRVSDTGIGIPEDKLERVFKRFYQVEHHLNRRFEGMGLGLAVSKELVELHNGRVWAESVIDKGSDFFVVLPSAPPA